MTVTKIVSRSRVTGATRDRLAKEFGREYEKGASVRALAEQSGRSYGFVNRLLHESGVHVRGRGGATRRSKSDC